MPDEFSYLCNGFNKTIIMKKLLLFLAGILIPLAGLLAQGEISKPIVIHAAYFDVSPPLRDMVKMGPGQVDMAWKDGVVKNNLYPFGRPKDDDSDAMDPLRQTWFGSHPTDTTIVNFQGLSGNGSICPPDTYGEVGPNHYFQCVNVSYQIFNKSGGSVLGPALNKTIWNGFPGPWQNSNDGDAVVVYDEQANRWLFSQFALPSFPNGPFYEMVAVSTTPDPTGTWYRYAFTFSDMPDYPKIGVWPDAYYMTINRFTSGSTNYTGTGTIAMDRATMLAGTPNATMVMFTLTAGNEAYCLLPADCDSDFPPAGTPCYVAYLNDGPDRIGIYEFHVDWANTANSTFTMGIKLPVTAFSGYVNGIPQKNTTVKVDDMSGRLMFRLPFRKFSDHWSMVANATINAGSGIAGIRWFEMQKTTGNWSIYQEGTYSPDANYRWMGSIAMDSSGNIALGYSISSDNMFPSIRYTGRLYSDPLGQMTIQESGIMNGGGSQTNTWSGTPSRWGDYSGMTVDPSAPATFWYTQEYYSSMSSASWKTRVASFSFANLLSVTATATPPSVCLGDPTQLNVTATGGSGTYTYSWTSIPPGFTSNIQNPVATPTQTTKYIAAVNDGTQTRTDTVDVPVSTLPVVYAGPDTTYPVSVPLFPTYGTASNYASILWTTSGDGHFNIDTVAACLYYPGPGDKANGVVTLTLTAQAIAPCTGEVADEAEIYLTPFPGIPDDQINSFGLTLVPNPTGGIVILNLTGLNGFETTVTVNTLQGKFVYHDLIGAGSLTANRILDLSGFPAGIYLVRVHSQLGTLVQKLILM